MSASRVARLLDALLPRRRQLARIRAKWTQPGAKDGWLADHYFELTRERSSANCVDDKTWADLEFPAIFSLLDSTQTPIGSQVLLRQLREYAGTPDELTRRYALYATLRADAPLREAIQRRLKRLEADSIRTSSGSVPQLARLAAADPERAKARRALLVLAFFRGRRLTGPADMLLQSLYYWLNMAFLTEVIAFARAMGRFAAIQPALGAAFETVGSLDAAIALASCLERCSGHCRPAISEGPVIAIEDGHHPLIAKPVKNSVRLEGRSALVTGSNMAGKTTFIKMVGINLILGRTAGFCFAATATIPWSGVMAFASQPTRVGTDFATRIATTGPLRWNLRSQACGSAAVPVTRA